MGHDDSKLKKLEKYRLEGNKIFKELKQKTHSNTEKLFLARTCVNIYSSTLKTTQNVKDIYKLNKNLGLSYSQIIEHSDYYSRLINATTLNEFMKSFIEMAKHYSDALCYAERHIKKGKYQELLASVENKCLNYCRLLSDNNHLSYMEKIVNEFEKVPPLKYTLTAYMARYYFISALKLYENKQHAKSKGMLYKIKDIINSSYNEQTKNKMSIEIQDIFCDTLESVAFYLNRNIIVQLLDNGIALYNSLPKVNYEKLAQDTDTSEPQEEENESVMDIKLNALSCFRDALNELTTEENRNVDIELEAICSSYLGTLLVSFKDKQIEKCINLCENSIRLGLSLAPKDVSGCDWFINAKMIIDTLVIKGDEHRKKQTLKRIYKDIFDELDEKSPQFESDDEQVIEFCKFVLTTYPPGKSEDKNVEKEIKENKKKFLLKLSGKYHPDNLPKETEEEFKNYVIFEHISKTVNMLYNQLKG